MTAKFYRYHDPDEADWLEHDKQIVSDIIAGFKAWKAMAETAAKQMKANGKLTTESIEQVQMSMEDEVLPIWSLMDEIEL